MILSHVKKKKSDSMVNESSETEKERKAKIKAALNTKFEDLQYHWQRLEYAVRTLLCGNDLSPHPTQQLQPLSSPTITSVRWKLDKRESGTNSRFRLIFRRDFFFADYKNCPRDATDEEEIEGGGKVLVTKRRSKFPPASIYFQPQLTEEEDDENIKLFVKGAKKKEKEIRKEKGKGKKKEKTVHSDVCSFITPLVTVKGNLKCTSNHLYFIPSKKEGENEREKEKTEKEKVKEKKRSMELAFPVGAKKKKWNGKSFERRESRWRKKKLSDIIGVFGRKHIHRPVGLEIFFADNSSYFFAFENKGTHPYPILGPTGTNAIHSTSLQR